jgi:hypothetical protein
MFHKIITYCNPVQYLYYINTIYFNILLVSAVQKNPLTIPIWIKLS